MKSLSVLGTAAMFAVGGSILVHGLPPVHRLLEHWATPLAGLPGIGGALAVVAPLLLGALFGVLAGGVVLMLAEGGKRLRRTARGAR